MAIDDVLTRPANGSAARHAEHIRQILDDISTGCAVSQRTLARRLGIALGLTNQLLRLLAARGLVVAARDRGTRVTYRLTDAGDEELSRMSRENLTRALAAYSATRARIRQRLSGIAALAGLDAPRVVFYGLNEAAEIGTACAAEAGIRLVGVVDDRPEQAGSVHGVPVRPASQLTSGALDGEPFDWLLVTALGRTEEIRRRLGEIGLNGERVSWL